uniref:Uncharacterized protein n=1 Tax=Oryzias melastigma TaxID=30732 RepID=A0A3B3CI13_ORYME
MVLEHVLPGRFYMNWYVMEFNKWWTSPELLRVLVGLTELKVQSLVRFSADGLSTDQEGDDMNLGFLLQRNRLQGVN